MDSYHSFQITLTNGARYEGDIIKRNPLAIIMRVDMGTSKERFLSLYHQGIVSIEDMG